MNNCNQSSLTQMNSFFCFFCSVDIILWSTQTKRTQIYFQTGVLFFVEIHKFQPRSNKIDNGQQISMARASVSVRVGITPSYILQRCKICANHLTSVNFRIGPKCDRHMIGKTKVVRFGAYLWGTVATVSINAKKDVNNKNNGHGNHKINHFILLHINICSINLKSIM